MALTRRAEHADTNLTPIDALYSVDIGLQIINCYLLLQRGEEYGVSSENNRTLEEDFHRNDFATKVQSPRWEMLPVSFCGSKGQ